MLIGTSTAGAVAPTVCAAGNPCAPPDPRFKVEKTAPTEAPVGAYLHYVVKVTNTGNVLITGSVSDDRCYINPSTFSLKPTEVATFDCYTYAPTSGNSVTNTACATAADDAGTPAVGDPGCASATTTLTHPLVVIKTVDEPTADLYDTLHYHVTFTNTTNTSGQPVTLYVEPYDYGCNGFDYKAFYLDPGESYGPLDCTDMFWPEGDEQTNTACGNAWIDNVIYEKQIPPYTTACDDATTTFAEHFVTGQVFEDMNADGVKDAGEPGIPGFVVYRDDNENGTRDSGEESTTTDDAGNYKLPVPLGPSTIRQETPGPWTCSFPAGCSYKVDLAKNSPPQQSRPVTNRAADPSGLDFGDWRPAAIGGTVIADANDNGVQDAGEGPVVGGLVWLDLNGNGTPDGAEPSTSSAADGTYSFPGLKPGSYVVRHGAPTGLHCNAPAGCTYSVALVSNQGAGGRDYLDGPTSQALLPARIVSGLARLQAKTGCVSGRFRVRVVGKRIRVVSFSLDGNRIRVLHRNEFPSLSIQIDPRRLPVGKHQVFVQVTFAPNARTKVKRMRVTFQRCGKQLVAPQFTG
jgi:hypothetical protein